MNKKQGCVCQNLSIGGNVTKRKSSFTTFALALFSFSAYKRANVLASTAMLLGISGFLASIVQLLTFPARPILRIYGFGSHWRHLRLRLGSLKSRFVMIQFEFEDLIETYQAFLVLSSASLYNLHVLDGELYNQRAFCSRRITDF